MITKFEKEIAKKVMYVDYPEIENQLELGNLQGAFVEMFENEDISLYLVAFMYRFFEESIKDGHFSPYIGMFEFDEDGEVVGLTLPKFIKKVSSNKLNQIRELKNYKQL